MTILDLPLELKKLAIKRTVEYYNKFSLHGEKISVEDINLEKNLIKAFMWHLTDDGFSFWNKINKQYF